MSILSETMLESGWDVLHEQLGRSVVYAPGGSGGGAVDALFEEQGAAFSEQSDGEHLSRRARLVVRASDVASPGRGDQVTVDAVKWMVSEVVGLDSGLYTLDLVRVEPTTLGGRGFRRQP